MIVCLGPSAARAEAPLLQSGTPVIYLAENLDEKEQLGWCIDTRGRGFAETLHAHSCKPAGRTAKDTQFSYDAESGQIRSVAFEEKCMAFSDPENKVQPSAFSIACPARRHRNSFTILGRWRSGSAAILRNASLWRRKAVLPAPSCHAT